MTSTIMDKSLGTLLRFWGVFQFTQVQPLPSPHKQCLTRVSRIFSGFQLCIGWGRENCNEISKMIHCFKRELRNYRKIWILQYCPKDFSLGLKSWTKVLGHPCVSGTFSNSHRSNPSPHPTNNVGRVYPKFFPGFNFL